MLTWLSIQHKFTLTVQRNLVVTSAQMCELTSSEGESLAGQRAACVVDSHHPHLVGLVRLQLLQDAVTFLHCHPVLLRHDCGRQQHVPDVCMWVLGKWVTAVSGTVGVISSEQCSLLLMQCNDWLLINKMTHQLSFPNPVFQFKHRPKRVYLLVVPPYNRPGSSLWHRRDWLSSKQWRWCWWLSLAPEAATWDSEALRHTHQETRTSCHMHRYDESCLKAIGCSWKYAQTWNSFALWKVRAGSVALGIVFKHQQSLGTQLQGHGCVQSCLESDNNRIQSLATTSLQRLFSVYWA